jgi:hypothetical protein
MMRVLAITQERSIGPPEEDANQELIWQTVYSSDTLQRKAISHGWPESCK